MTCYRVPVPICMSPFASGTCPHLQMRSWSSDPTPKPACRDGRWEKAHRRLLKAGRYGRRCTSVRVASRQPPWSRHSRRGGGTSPHGGDRQLVGRDVLGGQAQAQRPWGSAWAARTQGREGKAPSPAAARRGGSWTASGPGATLAGNSNLDSAKKPDYRITLDSLCALERPVQLHSKSVLVFWST